MSVTRIQSGSKNGGNCNYCHEGHGLNLLVIEEEL